MSNNQITLSGPEGSSATITLFGAHVVSFKSEYPVTGKIVLSFPTEADSLPGYAKQLQKVKNASSCPQSHH